MIDSVSDVPSSSTLLRRHAELEALHGDGDGGRFLSGWQCDNPWAEELRTAVAGARRELPEDRYQYLDNDRQITEGLLAFHYCADSIAPPAVFTGEGASALIFASCALLREKGIEEVFYVPPLYFAMHFALKVLGIRARPVSARHVFEPDFRANLSNQTTTLLLADPVWYAGIAVPGDIIERLVDWQRRTGSFVIVDGSFEYMRWDGRLEELSGRFDAARTIRILCPTKGLAMHGYRFAYALLPRELRAQYAHIYATIYGSATAESIAFARVSLAAMRNRKITSSLVGLISSRHSQLRASGKIAADWDANCGYFIFERVRALQESHPPLMDGSFFEQRRYPEHRRINLLSPSIGLLG